MELITRFVGPLRSGLLVGIIVIGLCAIPLAVVHYRRYGGVDRAGTLASYLLGAYIMVVLGVTLLPLPYPDQVRCVGHNIVPLQVIDDIRRAGGALHNQALFQLLYNVALFMPFGALLRRSFGRSMAVVAALGLGLSLVCECTQLTGVWGLYHCSYRFFDVDDLLANTGGALLGALAAPMLPVLPRRTGTAAAPHHAVTIPRRVVATAIDIVLVSVPTSWFVALISVVAVFVVVPAVSGGATPGKALVRLRLRGLAGERLPWHRLALRATVLVGPWEALHAAGRTGSHVLLVSAVVAGALYVIGTIAVSGLRADRRGPADLVCGSQVILADGDTSTPERAAMHDEPHLAG